MSNGKKPQMTQEEADKVLAKFEMFKPKDGDPKTVVIGAHGDHEKIKGKPEATFDTLEGLEVQYLGPHGQDLDAGLQVPFDIGKGLENYEAKPKGPENNPGQMYNYELSPFSAGYQSEQNSDEQYQRIADENKVVTMKLKDGKTSDSKELMTALKVKGYTKVVPIHCRGDRPVHQTKSYYPTPLERTKDNVEEKNEEQKLDKKKSETKKQEVEKLNTEKPDLSKLGSAPNRSSAPKKNKPKVKQEKAKNKGVKSKCFPW